MKMCWTLLITRDTQVKTMMSYHLRPVRTVILKKTTSVGKDVVKGHPYILFLGCKLVQPVWALNSSPGYTYIYIYMQENEKTNLKRWMHLKIYSSLIYNSQNMEVT